MNDPVAASDGTVTVTLMVHDALSEPAGPRLAPDNVRKPVPEIDEPVPQTSFIGNPVATSPETTVLRSSVKARSFTAAESSRLVMVNVSVWVLPATRSAANALARLKVLTLSMSLAGSPVTAKAPMSPVTSDVEFRNSLPASGPAGTLTANTILQLPAADRVPPA